MHVFLAELLPNYPKIVVKVTGNGSIITVSGLPPIYNDHMGIYMTEKWSLTKFANNVAVFEGPSSSDVHESILEDAGIGFDL